MGDARQVTERFIRHFRNVPAARSGVCRICHGGPGTATSTQKPFETCFSCRETTALARYTNHVVPISLCAYGDLLYRIVARHDEPAPESAFPDRSTLLAATVARFYQAHSACLAGLAGGAFSLVTAIPSTRASDRNPSWHSMRPIVDKVSTLRAFYQEVLSYTGEGASMFKARKPAENAYVTTTGLHGQRVLLLDDIFVSGAHVQSAASALLRAGAVIVVVLVIARQVDPDFNDNSAAIWRQALNEPFCFERCCLCGPRLAS
ncbi:hypothetical protein [Nonomuraea dietziae]|uniref:hypothetical protein n=1 Tax=Nonomuraea dietziae TaxID=65515 RepID=UPI003421C6E5